MHQNELINLWCIYRTNNVIFSTSHVSLLNPLDRNSPYKFRGGHYIYILNISACCLFTIRGVCRVCKSFPAILKKMYMPVISDSISESKFMQTADCPSNPLLSTVAGSYAFLWMPMEMVLLYKFS